MKKLKDELLSTDITTKRKRTLFLFFILMSFFPFFIALTTSEADLSNNLWQLRHFLGIAAIQAVAQISVAWYFLKNKVPNYVISSVIFMVLFFQLTFGMTVILITHT